MNEISKINPAVFKGYAVQANNVTNPISDNKPREVSSDFYIDSKGAQALKTQYTISSPLDIDKPISVNDYKTKLIQAGMVEGKDYDVIKNNSGGTSLFVENKNNNNSKAIFWSGGEDASNFDGYQDIYRPQNRPDIDETVMTYDKNNILEVKETRYKNAVDHKNLFPENIDLNTTAKDYKDILVKNNANFEMEETNDNGIENAIFAEKNANGNLIKMTSFSKYPDGVKFINQSSNPDKNGNLTKGVSILQDVDYNDLTISEYVKSLGISGKY